MSEAKSRTSHHVEDLSVLSRRGALSAAEQRAFASALEGSSTLATAHQLGLDFDQVAVVKPGDEALIAEVATRAMKRGRSAGARLRLRALLLAATLALAGSAAAFWKLARQPAGSALAPAAQVSSPSSLPPPAARPASATTATRSEPEPEPAIASGGRPTLAPTSGRAVAGPQPNEPAAPSFDSAGALFREANAARRSGELAVARALYLRLERDFPASDEAQLAHVSLGNLLLAMGRPGEAERQFAAYQGGRSALAQEAMVGRAQSLAALGRSADEKLAWVGLLEAYPSSVYAGRAKQRLAELARLETRPD